MFMWPWTASNKPYPFWEHLCLNYFVDLMPLLAPNTSTTLFGRHTTSLRMSEKPANRSSTGSTCTSQDIVVLVKLGKIRMVDWQANVFKHSIISAILKDSHYWFPFGPLSDIGLCVPSQPRSLELYVMLSCGETQIILR